MKYTKTAPPGFEGMPQYKIQKSTKDTTVSYAPYYSSIQSLCAKKWNIFLPIQGYYHPIVEETESMEQLYELAYRNEFYHLKHYLQKS